MLATHGLARSYGSLAALEPLTIDIPGGIVAGLLGSNGAGKTTLLNCLATLVEPTSGTALIDGFDIRAQALEARRVTGYVPEHASVYEGLTADEFLEMAAKIHGLDEATWRPRVSRLLLHLGLAEARSRKLGTYSKGMRTRAVLAAALLHAPRMLLLDEPMNGLDVPGQRLLGTLVREFAAAGGCVLYSSHVLEQVERVCDVLVLLHRGRLLWQGRVEDLRARHDNASLSDIFMRVTDGGTARSATWAELLGSDWGHPLVPPLSVGTALPPSPPPATRPCRVHEVSSSRVPREDDELTGGT